MFKKIKIYFLMLLIMLSLVSNVQARNFTHVSDFISTSAPGLQANHEITFRVTESIPPSGIIKIIPDNDFLIQAGFNYSDVDILTSTSSESGFLNREVATSSSLVNDTAYLGFIGTSTYIEIELNSSEGISSTTYVKILLGDNAVYGETGDKYLINPGAVGPYRVEVQSYTAGGSLLDRAEPMIFVIEPIRMISYMPKIRSKGSPTGTLSFGTVTTILSLATNYKASCSFSTASNTPYILIPNEFSYTGNYFHSEILTGLVGGLHQYYIRCRDEDLIDDITDYEIIFYVENYEGEGTGNSDSSSTDDGVGGDAGSDNGSSSGGGGSGGGGGGGSGGGSGNDPGIYDPYDIPPGDPAVDFSGFAYPNSKVYLLVDGVVTKNIIANSVGSFNFGIDELVRGIYTFGIWAEDREDSKSLTYNTTFYVEEGTHSSVSDIFISPTINTNTTEIDLGESMNLHGYGVANTFTEIWFYPNIERTLREEEIIKKEVDVDIDGLWNIILNTGDAFGGQYILKSRSFKDGLGYSEFGNIINIGLGEKAEVQTSECKNGDLNGDGKVNITDFSIMLYWWNTDNSCADQNDSSNVDLTDFSIMMFYWTG